MEFENKKLRDVADIAARIMMGEKALHPNQQKLDVHEPEKDELTAKDFEMLRNKKKVKENLEDFSLEEIEEFMVSEEFEQLDELSKSTLGSYVNKASDSAAKNAAGSVGMANTSLRAKNPRVKAAAEKYSNEDEATKQKRLSGIGKAVKKLTKEEVEELDEVSLKTATSAYVKRMGDDGPNEKSSIAKATKTMDHIANKHGVRGVARATKTADDKYGLNDPVHNPRKAFVKQIMQSVKKEDVDAAAATILEYESKDGKFVHRARPGAYGGTKDERHAVDTMSGPKEKDLKNIEKDSSMYKKGYHGTSKNYLRKDTQDYFAKRFSEDLDLYKEGGIKGLFEAWAKKKKMAEDVEVLDEGIEVKKEYNDKTEAEHGVYHNNKKIGYVVHHKPSGTHTAYHSPQGDDDYGQIDDFHSHHDAVKQIRHSAGVGVHEEVEHISEEPTSAEFDAQLADAKQRAAGTKKQPEVSKPAVQAVQNEETHTTVEFIDYNDVNGVKISEIDLDERSLSEPEMKKKEEIVKSMKKGISGFKERYGKDAKSVMYATATARAKGE